MIGTNQGQRVFRIAATLGLALAASSCTATNPSGIYYATGKDSVTPDGLHRVRWEPFSTSFVKPGANLQKYDAVMIDRVTIAYARPPAKPRYPADSREDNFALTSTTKQSLEKWFRKAFVSALTRSDTYKLATEPGPNVLLVSGHLVDLQITVPPLQQQAPGQTIVASSAGAVTLVLDVNDSETGEPLVRVGQRSELSLGGDSNLFFVSGGARSTGAFVQLFNRWSGQLRRELDQLRSIPAIPAVPEASP